MTIQTALLSVSDKTGIVDFARALVALGVKIVSTGGTAALLKAENIPAIEVAELTGFPEMMDGRVKTLHPKVHAGILARRNDPQHLAAMQQAGIATIDLVVVNLYPFQSTIARADCSFELAIENVDIGGPTMLRAAAKNHQDVTVVMDPQDYEVVVAEMQAMSGSTALQTRLKLAQKVFAATAAYDLVIAQYLNRHLPSQSNVEVSGAAQTKTEFKDSLNLEFYKLQDLRYGENPHQQAAFYVEKNPPVASLASFTQLQGKELSFNNIVDADTAWECVKQFAQTACVIVKHANPCGVALAGSAMQAYKRAFQTDSTSAFGGIIALNTEIDEDAALAVSGQFVEVLIAPKFSARALAIFATKTNLRVLQIALPQTEKVVTYDYKRVAGGLLMQHLDQHQLKIEDLKVVTDSKPNLEQLEDCLFAWRVAQFVKSNAVIFCKNGQTLGVGAGQMSRIDSAKIARIKAEQAGLSLQGSVVASDAFFPFRDGLDAVVSAGARCVIQPGGSVRDDEVIAAANQSGVVMVFTGVRHFRH